MLFQHRVPLQYTLLQHPLSSKDNASTSGDIFTAASHATAASAALIPGSTSTHIKVNVAATFGQKMSSVWAYFTKLHRRFRPRDEPGQERHAACVTETASGIVCSSTTVPRLLVRHLHKASYYVVHPRRFSRRNTSYERSCFRRITTQAHPRKVVLVTVSHGSRPGPTRQNTWAASWAWWTS